MSGRLSSVSNLGVGPGSRAFYPLLLAGLVCAYVPVLAGFFRLGIGEAVIDGIANVAAIALVGVAMRAVLLRFVFGLPSFTQAIVHPLLAIVFSLLLYWVLRILLGIVFARDALEFRVTPFILTASVWQVLQGIAYYMALAFAVYAEVARARLAAALAQTAAAPGAAAPSRLFVRQDEEVRPLDPARIILARGADDYAELVTDAGIHLVRMTLATLGERLGPRFIRVHRSCLVNTDRIGRAEPAGGGRMLLHLDSGEMLTTSRAGGRLLRERII